MAAAGNAEHPEYETPCIPFNSPEERARLVDIGDASTEPGQDRGIGRRPGERVPAQRTVLTDLLSLIGPPMPHLIGPAPPAAILADQRISAAEAYEWGW